jgi:hypothetical protein
MEIVKGGIITNPPKYSLLMSKEAYKLIEDLRSIVILPKNTERGPRFNNNDMVLLRLESNFTEGEFMKCPGLTVISMLIDTAAADYWYSHEKQYDDLEDETGSMDDNDE